MVDDIKIVAVVKMQHLRQEYRSGRLQVSQALSDLCLPLELLYSTAVEKEDWWYDDFLDLLGRTRANVAGSC